MTRAGALLLLALSACGGGAAPAATPVAPAPSVERELASAEAAERARRHDEARTHYERAVAAARDPRSVAKARRAFGETLAHWGELPAAIAQLEGAVAALHWRAGDRAPAAAEYRALLELDLPGAIRSKVEWALAELAKPPT